MRAGAAVHQCADGQCQLPANANGYPHVRSKAMFGIVPPNSTQKPHRHQSIALDFIAGGNPRVCATVGTELDEKGDISESNHVMRLGNRDDVCHAAGILACAFQWKRTRTPM